jgi:hypothetical protein
MGRQLSSGSAGADNRRLLGAAVAATLDRPEAALAPARKWSARCIPIDDRAPSQ